MSTQLDQIAKKAKSNPKLRFTSLAHLLTPEFLTETWKQMNRRGTSGVDGETTKEFELDLDTRVRELRERLQRGAYRAPPVRRVEIPKAPYRADRQFSVGDGVNLSPRAGCVNCACPVR